MLRPGVAPLLLRLHVPRFACPTVPPLRPFIRRGFTNTEGPLDLSLDRKGWSHARSHDLLTHVRSLEEDGKQLHPRILQTIVTRLAIHQPQEALSYLDRLQKLGNRPRGPVLTSAVKAAVTLEKFDTALALLNAAELQDHVDEHLSTSGELAAYGALVHGLCRVGRVKEATEVVQRLRRVLPSTAASAMGRIYESLLLGAGMTHNPLFAWEIYMHLKDLSITPSPAGITFLVRALLPATSGTEMLMRDQLNKLEGAIQPPQGESWVNCLRQVLNTARREGRMTVGVWSAMLAVQGDPRGKLEAAEQTYNEMIEWLKDRPKSWVGAGDRSSDEQEELRRAFRHMLRAYSMRGNGVGCDGVIKDMHQVSIALRVQEYTALFGLCALEPASCETGLALRLFNAMRLRGTQPDRLAWLQCLAALARGSRADDLMTLWDERKSTGKPLASEYITTVRGLVRAGKWAEAVSEFKAIPRSTPELTEVLRRDMRWLSPLEAVQRAARTPSLPSMGEVVTTMIKERPALRARNMDSLLLGLGRTNAPNVAAELYEFALRRDSRPRDLDVHAAVEAQAANGHFNDAVSLFEDGFTRGWRPDAATALLVHRFPRAKPEQFVNLIPPVPTPPPFLLAYIERTEMRARVKAEEK